MRHRNRIIRRLRAERDYLRQHRDIDSRNYQELLADVSAEIEGHPTPSEVLDCYHALKLRNHHQCDRIEHQHDVIQSIKAEMEDLHRSTALTTGLLVIAVGVSILFSLIVFYANHH